jgi:hypothetical protein
VSGSASAVICSGTCVPGDKKWLDAHRRGEEPQSPTHRLVDGLLDELHHELLRMVIVVHEIRVIGSRGRVDGVEIVKLTGHIAGDFYSVALHAAPSGQITGVFGPQSEMTHLRRERGV